MIKKRNKRLTYPEVNPLKMILYFQANSVMLSNKYKCKSCILFECLKTQLWMQVVLQLWAQLDKIVSILISCLKANNKGLNAY